MSKANRRSRKETVVIPHVNGGISALCDACQTVILRAREDLTLGRCPACGGGKWRVGQLARFDYARAIDQVVNGGKPLPKWVTDPQEEPWRGL